MRAKVTSESNFVRVERSGSWVFYTATNAEVKVTTGKFTLTKQHRVKAGYVKLGELDARVGTAVLALASDIPWYALANLLPKVTDTQQGAVVELVTQQKPRHLHWLFTEHLSSIIDASQYVGSPPTA
jgi:hypothetical protein